MRLASRLGYCLRSLFQVHGIPQATTQATTDCDDVTLRIWTRGWSHHGGHKSEGVIGDIMGGRLSKQRVDTWYSESIDSWYPRHPCRAMPWPADAVHNRSASCRLGRSPCPNKLWVVKRGHVACGLGEGYFTRAARTARMLLDAVEEASSTADFGPIAIDTSDASCNRSALTYGRGRPGTAVLERWHIAYDPQTCREGIVPDWVCSQGLGVGAVA